MNNRKGQSAFTGFAVIAVGLILLSLPTVYNEGINDFGLAATEGIQLAAEFPPWENRTDTEMNVDYSVDGIGIQDGEVMADYRTLELSNEPDEFRLIELDYNTTLPQTDSEIEVTAIAYDPGEIGNAETQTFVLDNGSSSINLEERLVGEYLRIEANLSRQNQNDPSPVLHSMDVSVKTLDGSDISVTWQNMLMLAIIGFTVTLIALLLGS